jgi:hypothetical protein
MRAAIQRCALWYQARSKPVCWKKHGECITLADSVDFDAETVIKGYRTEFVRANYHTQSAEWKQLYHLGREPVQVARDRARTGLNKLD